jgi:hypothetical protein
MTVMKFSKPWDVVALTGSTAAGVAAVIDAAWVVAAVMNVLVWGATEVLAAEAAISVDPSALVKFAVLVGSTHFLKLSLGVLTAAAILGAV